MLQVQEEESILTNLLQTTACYHQHLCPRQVLGVRMGLYAGTLLDLTVPQKEKRLITFIETDGCFLDGVAVSTGCTVGARTMRVFDFGKMAATFMDRKTGTALRIIPNLTARELCVKYASNATDRWHTYLYGYQEMPEEELFTAQSVVLSISLAEILSRKDARVTCAVCGEEVFNEREIRIDGVALCQTCAGRGYYTHANQ